MNLPPSFSFLGAAYFALQEDTRFLQFLDEGQRLYGGNQPVSRLNALPAFSLLTEVEASLAEQLGMEAACLYSSGFLAGVALRQHLLDRARESGWRLLSSEDCHPCLAPLTVHKGPARTGAETLDQLAREGVRNWVALCNGVDIFQGVPDPALDDGVFTEALWRVVDVSHGVFIWDHRHIISSLGRPGGRTLLMGSLGKAGAFPAGFVAGPEEMIKSLRRGEIFNAASPPPAAHAHAFHAAASLRREQRARLQALMGRADALFAIDRPESPRFPAYPLTPANEATFDALCGQGFRLSFLSYPTPEAQKSLRMVLNAAIPEAALIQLVELLHAKGVRYSQPMTKTVRWRFSP